MITYVNNDNSSRYTVLYAKATQDLIKAQIEYNNGRSELNVNMPYVTETNESGETVPAQDAEGYIAVAQISTIEQFFSYLPMLVQLGDVNSSSSYKVLHSLGRRYTMLPLMDLFGEDQTNENEEYLFKIDANKRVIDVPKNFASNGVAVQGDQLAEVLYFEIDRFFDAKDLDDSDIFIQWTNANGESGLSAPVVIDIESKPNKIIFGWALSDAITEKAGTIQFAVRFYQWYDDAKTKLAYSLSTQTANVVIKQSLDFKLNEDYLQQVALNMKAENELLMARIKGGNTYVTDNEEALPPVYVLNLKDNEDVVYNAEEKIVYVDLARDEVADDDIYVLKVQAKSIDSGIISYGWTFESITEPGVLATGSTLGSEADPSHSVPKIVYERTNDETPQDKVYYKQTTVNDVTSYKPFDVAGLPDGKTPKSEGLFEKIATLTVTQVGKFFATATNSKAGSNSATTDSDICVVPMPTEPVIDTQVSSSEVLREEDGEKVTLTVACSNEETNGTHEGILTYQWFKQKLDPQGKKDTDVIKEDDEIVWEPLEGETNESLVINYSASADPKNVEGFYKVVVYNTKNGETVSMDSAESHVTYYASKPVISFPATSDDTSVDFSNPNSVLKVKLGAVWSNKWNISDNISYQWYFTKDETIGNTEVDTEEILIEGATSDTFRPDKAGKYYCVVTNEKNGSEASEASLIFYLI